MNFASMNFGDLLFALNCDPLKNEIRKIQKINKCIVQTKNGIYFNEMCLKEGLRPKFSNIYIGKSTANSRSHCKTVKAIVATLNIV